MAAGLEIPVAAEKEFFLSAPGAISATPFKALADSVAH
jgi:hypothetical protein